jgi:hypothetical protein
MMILVVMKVLVDGLYIALIFEYSCRDGVAGAVCHALGVAVPQRL